MKRKLKLCLTISYVVALGSEPALAAVKTERGPVHTERGTQDGKPGTRVRYNIYTLKDDAQIQAERQAELDRLAREQAERDRIAREAAEAAAQRQRDDDAAAQRQRDADAAAQRQREADAAAAASSAPPSAPQQAGPPPQAPSPPQQAGPPPQAPSPPQQAGPGPQAPSEPAPPEEGPAPQQASAKDEKLRQFLLWNGRPITVDGRSPENASFYTNKHIYNVAFARPIDFRALDRVLGHPSYVGKFGSTGSCGTCSEDKRAFIESRDRPGPDGGMIIDLVPNTTSAFLEASRLARMYLLLERGARPSQSTISTGYWAFWRENYDVIPFEKEAILAKINEIFRNGIDTSSPIALDLNHDGKIGVTGLSTAAVRKPKNARFVSAGSVRFDLAGYGEKQRFEWLNRDGDGFLVYDGDGALTQAAKSGGEINGRPLFGNAVGYDHGFQKLALFTGGIAVALDQVGKVPNGVFDRTKAKGMELSKLKVWVDHNGDARPQIDELFSLANLGITEVGLLPKFERNKDGEVVIRSYFVQNGKREISEDVWFAQEPAANTPIGSKGTPPKTGI